MIGRDKRLAKIFPKCPRPVFRRDTNIKELLIRAKLAPNKKVITRTTSQANTNYVTRCNKGTGRPECAMCPYVTDYPNQSIREIKIVSSGVTVPIQGRLTCKSSGPGGFIYCLTNTKTNKQYIGESGRQKPVDRFREHRNDIDNQRYKKCVPKHFVDNNSSSEDLKFIPFLAVNSKNPYVRKFLEREFINNHNLIEEGINVNL